MSSANSSSNNNTGASPTSMEGPDGSPTLSYEEFKAMYEARVRQEYLRQRGVSANANTNAPPIPRDGGGANTMMAAAAPPPVAPPAADAPPTWQAAIERVVRHLLDRIANDVALFIQSAIAAVVLSSDLSWRTFGLVALYYVVFAVIRFVVKSVRLRSPISTRQGATPLGRMWSKYADPATGNYPAWVKLCYVSLKSLEALIVSLSPSYSPEHLEREVVWDGIMTERTAPAAAAAEPTASPTGVAAVAAAAHHEDEQQQQQDDERVLLTEALPRGDSGEEEEDNNIVNDGEDPSEADLEQ